MNEWNRPTLYTRLAQLDLAPAISVIAGLETGLTDGVVQGVEIGGRNEREDKLVAVIPRG